MNIPLDESIQGFLLRQQLVFAKKFDPKGVITKDGQWYSEPYAHHEVLHIFHRFDDFFLLEKIENGKPKSSQGYGFFDSPSAYCESLNSTFFAGEKKNIVSKRRKQAIYFCPECVSFAISEFGFGYFKHDWLNTKWCHEHKIALYCIKPVSYQKSVLAVQLIIRGDIPDGAFPAVNAQPNLSVIPEEKKPASPEFLFPVRAVDCMIESIGAWLLENLAHLPKLHASSSHTFWRKMALTILFRETDILGFMDAAEVFDVVLFNLNRHKDFSSYIESSVEYLKVPVSPRKQFTEIVMAPKKRNCIKCSRYTVCEAAEKNIEIVDEYIDIQFFFKHSTSFRRFAFEQGFIIATGDTKWSPFEINTSMSTEEIENARLMTLQL